MLFPESKSWIWVPILAPTGMFSLFGMKFFREPFDVKVMSLLFLVVLLVTFAVLVGAVVKTIVDKSRFWTALSMAAVLAFICFAVWLFDFDLLSPY